MTTPKLWKQWRTTRAHLEAARQMLPKQFVENDGSDQNREIATIQSYVEYLEHNELELALDQLEGIGRLNDVRGEFWQTLAKAATMMELHERVSEYEAAFDATLSNRLTDGDVATEQRDERES